MIKLDRDKGILVLRRSEYLYRDRESCDEDAYRTMGDGDINIPIPEYMQSRDWDDRHDQKLPKGSDGQSAEIIIEFINEALDRYKTGMIGVSLCENIEKSGPPVAHDSWSGYQPVRRSYAFDEMRTFAEQFIRKHYMPSSDSVSPDQMDRFHERLGFILHFCKELFEFDPQ